MMLYDQQEVARHHTRERLDRALRRSRTDDEEESRGPRHRMAVVLRRIADRLEPPPVPNLRNHRRSLTASGRL